MPRPRLRYVVYFLILLGAILSTCGGSLCTWRVWDSWLPVVCAVVIITFVELALLIRRSHVIVKHLQEGDVQRFLEETDKELKYSSGSWRHCYLVNKTAGLYYLGQWDQAIEILDDVPYQKLPKMYQILYVNNRLANLIAAGRIDEAGELINAHPEAFEKSKHNQAFFATLQSNLGTYKFARGQLDEARELIESNVPEHKHRLAQAVSHYYLGMIHRQQGRIDEAERYLNKARELGKNSYLEHV